MGNSYIDISVLEEKETFFIEPFEWVHPENVTGFSRETVRKENIRSYEEDDYNRDSDTADIIIASYLEECLYVDSSNYMIFLEYGLWLITELYSSYVVHIFPSDMREHLPRESNKLNHIFDDVEYYSEFFQPVVVSGLIHQNSILNNNYLSKELSNVLLKRIEVFGDEIGRKIKCPCCYFYALSGRLSYDICSICYWEGPGGDELSYSSANHNTLSEYRNKFFINHDKAELEKYIFTKKADIF